MAILKSICFIFLYERPPCLSGMCSNDDDDDDEFKMRFILAEHDISKIIFKKL